MTPPKLDVVLFCHSLASDWNHGNAHFLRGVVGELAGRGHAVRVYEPRDAWSRRNLALDHGEAALTAFRAAYPTLAPILYDPPTLDLDEALAGADLVLVHEWSPPELVRRVGRHRRAGGRYTALFHDTHHRASTDRAALAELELRNFDGVLAFGDAVRQAHLEAGWARQAFTWHEAADTRLFRPGEAVQPDGDLVWIGNWGDGERSRELHEFLIEPVRELGLRARVFGVRYPPEALAALGGAGIEYGGYLPNFAVPAVLARHRVTIHVPRRPYLEALPGVPTIRVFETLACGVPLVSAPWRDHERLFSAGRDYLVARDRVEMAYHLRAILGDPALARALADHGRATVLARHTCAHRVDELLRVCRLFGQPRHQRQAS